MPKKDRFTKNMCGLIGPPTRNHILQHPFLHSSIVLSMFTSLLCVPRQPTLTDNIIKLSLEIEFSSEPNVFPVTISGSSFKGFFLQARDPDTDNWIGSWAQTDNTNTHPECSAVTHADPYVKQHATLIWNAPPNARGRVYFT